MQLKLHAPLILMAAVLAVVSTNGCRNNPPQSPSVVVPSPVLDTNGVLLLVDTSMILIDSGNVALAVKYMEKVVTKLMDADMDSLAESYARPFIVSACAIDSNSIIDSLLDRIITRMSDNPKSGEYVGSFIGLKGFVLQIKGRFLEANESYWSSLKLLPEKKFARKWAVMLNNIAQNYNSIGDYKQGEKYADQALHFIETYRGSLSAELIQRQTFKDLYALGWAYYEQGHTVEAVNCFNAALKLTTGDDQCDVLTFMSKCCQDAGQIDSAFIFINRAINVWESANPGSDQIYIDGIHQLARCHLAAGNLTTSLKYFNTELPFAIDKWGHSHPDCYKIKVYTGWIYERMNLPEQALAAFQQAINMSLNTDVPIDSVFTPEEDQIMPDYWLMEALSGKSKILERLYCLKHQKGDLSQALKSAELAIVVKSKLFDIFETDISKTDIAAFAQPLYEMTIRQALTLGNTSKAYYWVQHAKAAILREKIASDQAFERLPDSLITEYQALKLNINTAQLSKNAIPESGLPALEARLQILEHKICLISPSFAALRKPLPPLEDDFIRNNLPDDAAILDFFCGDSLVYVFAVCKNDLKVYQTVPTADYRNNIKTLGESVLSEVNNQSATALISSSRQCYRYLLEAPLRDISRQVPEVKRLWIVPDGVLHYLPFDVLLTAEVNAKQNQRMPYLIRKYATGYAFAAQQFFQPASTGQPLAPYSGWGIQYDSLSLMQMNQGETKLLAMRDYGPLPKARQEVEAVNQLFGGAVWLDSAAHKSVFLKNAGKFNIFHFAMHAIADDTSSEASRLVFSPEMITGNAADSYLSVAEISALSLKADLVVLSACKTANGRLMTGEGISSLGRAFQFAGARSVLMTQWEANDEAAFKVIPTFFEQIKAGENKDIALQQAKLSMLDNPSFAAFQAPLYWACFIISGDMQPCQDTSAPWWKWALSILTGLVVLWLVWSRSGQRRK